MIIYNYYFAILILALIFFFISNKNTSILISIIIIIIIGYYYFSKINIHNENLQSNFTNKIKTLSNDIQNKPPVFDTNFYLKKFPEGIRYLKNDKYLIELILNLRFVKVFDDAKYSKLLLLFEDFMKVYIFMLGDRYDIRDYFTTFLDLRLGIIKELYGIYVICPIKIKNIYGINTFETIKTTINDFMKHSRKMILIIEKYAYEKKGIYYLQDTKYKPFEKNSNEVF